MTTRVLNSPPLRDCGPLLRDSQVAAGHRGHPQTSRFLRGTRGNWSSENAAWCPCTLWLDLALMSFLSSIVHGCFAFPDRDSNIQTDHEAGDCDHKHAD
mmetsp:Transcript_83614/g.250660  ORF Transcript_83614/g.250660 Transcript_83614/m.250660 type:complete len:99 (+) Transcript_83614:66-362(+)